MENLKEGDVIILLGWSNKTLNSETISNPKYFWMYESKRHTSQGSGPIYTSTKYW